MTEILILVEFPDSVFLGSLMLQVWYGNIESSIDDMIKRFFMTIRIFFFSFALRLWMFAVIETRREIWRNEIDRLTKKGQVTRLPLSMAIGVLIQ